TRIRITIGIQLDAVARCRAGNETALIEGTMGTTRHTLALRQAVHTRTFIRDLQFLVEHLAIRCGTGLTGAYQRCESHASVCLDHGESSPMTSPKERRPSPSSALSSQLLRMMSYKSPGEVTIWPTS